MQTYFVAYSVIKEFQIVGMGHMIIRRSLNETATMREVIDEIAERSGHEKNTIVLTALNSLPDNLRFREDEGNSRCLL